MVFQIDFNAADYYNDDFLINKLGAYSVPSKAIKYGPFELLHIEVKDFVHLEQLLKLVDKQFNCISSAVISFDSATLYIDIQ